jgi:ABC-2 type transport system permease protein
MPRTTPAKTTLSRRTLSTTTISRGTLARTTLATAGRVLRQLRRDPRTVLLLIVVPNLLLILVRYSFDGKPQVFQRAGLPLVGIFPLVSMFLVASIAMLRERRSGTLERLMTMPTSKFGVLLGYATAFGALATVQAVVVLSVAIVGLGLDVAGPIWLAVVVAVANALLGMAMGLFFSAFAHTEFQAIQFMPAFILPQFMLCGLLVARSAMARPLEVLSVVMPLTYAYDALRAVADEASPGRDLGFDLLITVAMALAALAGGALTLPRRTP